MAIAFDAASEGNVGSGSSLTVSHTCTGSNRILWAAVFTTGNDTITGVTYNGVAMTQASKATTASSQTAYTYYLIAPATGANNIVASDSGTNNLTIVGMSFTGAKQSAQPDSFGSATGNSTLATVDLTTVADNSFAVYCCRFNTGTRSAGTGMTIAGGTSIPATGGYTTNAKTPAGTQTMSENSSASTVWGIAAASFAPSTTTEYVITAAVGTFVLTGVAAAIGRLYTLAAAQGSFVLTGIDAAFKVAITMSLATGAFVLTGVDVGLGFAYRLIASTGSFILTGFAALFPWRWAGQLKNLVSWTNQNKNDQV